MKLSGLKGHLPGNDQGLIYCEHRFGHNGFSSKITLTTVNCMCFIFSFSHIPYKIVEELWSWKIRFCVDSQSKKEVQYNCSNKYSNKNSSSIEFARNFQLFYKTVIMGTVILNGALRHRQVNDVNFEQFM